VGVGLARDGGVSGNGSFADTPLSQASQLPQLTGVACLIEAHKKARLIIDQPGFLVFEKTYFFKP